MIEMKYRIELLVDRVNYKLRGAPDIKTRIYLQSIVDKSAQTFPYLKTNTLYYPRFCCQMDILIKLAQTEYKSNDDMYKKIHALYNDNINNMSDKIDDMCRDIERDVLAWVLNKRGELPVKLNGEKNVAAR